MNYPNMVDARKRGKEEVKYIYENRNYNEVFKGKKYFIKTYGCQMNVHDSEEIKKILENLGYTEIEDYEQADLIILNTCAIRENAHDKVFGFLGRCKHLKKTNKDLILGLCGCMAQEENVVKEIREKHKYIDIVFGTHNMNELPDMLMNFYGKQSINVYSKEGDVIEFGNLYKRDSKITAWVNIMYGCDKFCTYCIVPYTRGQQISRSKEDIIDEIKHLMQNGLKEVTLIGQNVNSYGLDFKDKTYHFKDLLEDIAKLNIPRIRFSTSNPWNLNKDLIDVMAKYDNIMPYIHLPIQSGDEEILKQMNRKMLIKDYIDLVDYLREKIPDISISTDLIVGFPNESSEAFRHTIDLYNRIKYDNAYTFIYSKREGTPAAKIIDHVTLTEKKKRLYELDELVRKYAKEANEKFVGKVLDVLVDGVSKNNAKRLTGYSPQWKVVNFTGDAKIGDIVKVKINEASRFSLSGKQVKN